MCCECLAPPWSFFAAFSEEEKAIPSDGYTVDFGRLLLGQEKKRVFKIVNEGRYDFTFRWRPLKKVPELSAGCLSIHPAEGEVALFVSRRGSLFSAADVSRAQAAKERPCFTVGCVRAFRTCSQGPVRRSRRVLLP